MIILVYLLKQPVFPAFIIWHGFCVKKVHAHLNKQIIDNPANT